MDEEVNSTVGAEVGIGGRFGLGGRVALGGYLSESTTPGKSGYLDQKIPDEIGISVSISGSAPTSTGIPTSAGLGARGYVGVTVSTENAKEYVEGIDIVAGGMYGYGAYTSFPNGGSYKPNVTVVAGIGADIGVEVEVTYALAINSEGIVFRGEGGSTTILPVGDVVRGVSGAISAIGDTISGIFGGSSEFSSRRDSILGHVDKWRSQRRIDVMSMKPMKLSAVLS